MVESRIGSSMDASLETRLAVIAVGIILVFVVFLLRLFQLQVVEWQDLVERSERNSIHRLRLEAPRGDLLDREGRLLATTRPAFGVEILPSELKRRAVTLATLAQLIDRDAAGLETLVGNPQGRARYQPIRVASDLSYDELARVESYRYALPGVVTDVRPRRYYIYGDLAAHLFGSLGEIRSDQLKRLEFSGYRSGEIIGQTGLESVLERHLRGREGGRVIVVDVAGREVELLDEIDPVAGGSVTLTIDLDLQRAAEASFRANEPEGEDKMGALVALDPRNGDVLAMVARPAFDPNDFAGGVDTATWNALNSDEWHPLNNRALSGQYPPGSTFKAIVAAAALADNVVSPNERVYCPGHFRLGRRTYRCWKRGGHGEVNLHDALKASCDVYFYTVGLKLGIDRIAYYAKKFGLGRKTGIEIGPERAGLIPSTDWKERRLNEKWILGETVSASIGQGYDLVTPIQLAIAYAAIANGGEVLVPHLVLERKRLDGESIEVRRREVRGTLPLSATALEAVRQGLFAVVQDKEGTGGRARIPGISVAGKTGTSQVVQLKRDDEQGNEDEIPFKYRDHAWFVAFAPVEDPEIVVAVLVEHGGHGGSAAAPLAKAVMETYFAKHAAEERAGEGSVDVEGHNLEAQRASAQVQVTETIHPSEDR